MGMETWAWALRLGENRSACACQVTLLLFVLYHGSIEYWLLQVNPKFGPTDWVKHCIPAPHLASLFFLGRRTWITQWGIILLMSIGKYHQRDHITEAYISNLIPYLPDSTYREYRFAPPRILT